LRVAPLLFANMKGTLLSVVLCLGAAAVGFLAGQKHRTAPSATLAKAEAIRDVTASAAPTQDNTSDASSQADIQSRWDALFAEANTPARNRQLAALIEDIARTDPQRALALAQAVEDWRLRSLLRNAAVRGWAQTAPDAAADWALTARENERREVVEALLQGAAHNPDEAVRVARRLCESDPALSTDYGQYTVAALADQGAFDAAVRFSTEIGVARQPFLLKSAFFQWARNQPERALDELEKLSDPIARNLARGEAIAGWAWADARAVAEHAMQLPAGADRRQMLAEALPLWVERDPHGAAEWIAQADRPADVDAGVEAMANLQSLITQQPTLALELAASISDPARRRETQRNVFRQWAQNDRAAAQRFAASAPNPQDRATFAGEIQDLWPDD